jgi:hypothetical protein
MPVPWFVQRNGGLSELTVGFWLGLTMLCCCCCCTTGNNSPEGAAAGSKGEAISMTSPVRMEIQDSNSKKKGEAIAMT